MMDTLSIDDRPDGPVGTPQIRRAKAIHWHWTTEYTYEEIAAALGVQPRTVKHYLNSRPNEEVKEMMDGIESDVRMVAVRELQEQLRTAGHRSRTADTPVEVWTDDDGQLVVVDDVDNESGQVVSRHPVPRDFTLGADHQERYYARDEVREILEQLADLTGAAEPEQVEHSGGVSIRDLFDGGGE